MARKRGGFAKTAPKTLERRIIENAKRIREDLSVILPTAMDERSKRIMEKIENKLIRVWKYRDDLKVLEKLSMKKGLEGALAGTLTLAITEKAPYLAHLKVGERTIPFAVRGKSDRDKLASLQHFDDPIVRLLAFRDIAFKKKLSFYSWEDNFICCSSRNPVPEDFVEFLSRLLGLRRKGKILECDHLKREYLWIRVKDLEIRRCRSCLPDENTLLNISKYFIDPSLDEHVDIGIESKLLDYGVSLRYREDYLKGTIGDGRFFEENLRMWRNELRGRKEKLIYLDGEIISAQDLLEKLGVDDMEKKALEILLSKVDEPIFVDKPDLNSLLRIYWKEYGLDVLEGLSGKRELAKRIYERNGEPLRQIRDLEASIIRMETLSRYPVPKLKSSTARFVDKMFREYLIGGKERLLSTLSKPPQEVKSRSIAYAFLLALGKGEERKWQYRKEEIELGEFLVRYVKDLLESKPEDYPSKLKELLAVAGIDEDVT